MQGLSMSSTSCFWQIERMELIQGRGCSPVLAKTSLCQIWSHSTCRRAPFLIWGPLWTELPPTALKELSLPFEFKTCILWIKTCYISICYKPSHNQYIRIRRKDFQFETLRLQECCEIWFSFFHCLLFLQERFNTWQECSERLGNLRSGFKDITAWLDSAQHQLKVCFSAKDWKTECISR